NGDVSLRCRYRTVAFTAAASAPPSDYLSLTNRKKTRSRNTHYPHNFLQTSAKALSFLSRQGIYRSSRRLRRASERQRVNGYACGSSLQSEERTYEMIRWQWFWSFIRPAPKAAILPVKTLGDRKLTQLAELTIAVVRAILPHRLSRSCAPGTKIEHAPANI